MKRRDLMRQLAAHARAASLEIEVTEGRSHTKVVIGDLRTVVPRHSEINEITAQQILKQIGADR